MEPITLIASLLPTISYTIKKIVDRVSGGAKPQNVEDLIKLQNLEIEKLKALAEIDKTENASQWVNDLRGSIRPIAVILILIIWFICSISTIGHENYETISNLASSVMFYLFGERSLLYIKKG